VLPVKKPTPTLLPPKPKSAVPPKSILKKPDPIAEKKKKDVVMQQKSPLLKFADAMLKSPSVSVLPMAKKMPEVSPNGTKDPVKVKLPRHTLELLHNKDYYWKVNNEDKTRCLLCRGSFKFITKHYKEKHRGEEVNLKRFNHISNN